MNLDALNSFISVGIGINLVYALFDDLRTGLSRSVVGSFGKLFENIKNTIQEFDSIKDGLSKQLVAVNSIKDSFDSNSQYCTRLAKKLAIFATVILFVQLFVASINPVGNSYIVYSEVYTYILYVDLFLTIMPLVFCLISNMGLSAYYKGNLNKVNEKIDFVRTVQPSGLNNTDVISEEQIKEMLS